MFRLLLGFADRKESEDLISQSSRGTFLLRFSESELGGITVAWVVDRRNCTPDDKWMMGNTASNMS
jgi:signal transducer and activator of transcription 5B